ncbi:MAG: nucleotidyltransferase domain-containing protein [Deltaproteobacteria bacterium]|nr:nucleotidyltransferase domain-containing protein [Deltaproteobacteria bacterium]
MSADLATTIVKYLGKQPGIGTIYLFGSRAKGKAAVSSDVDIAVLYEADQVPDARTLLDLRENLAAHLQVDRVDLVLLNRANPILKYQVFRYGKCLLNRNTRHHKRFLVRSMTEYADVKRMRAPIERSLSKGRIYGR